MIHSPSLELHHSRWCLSEIEMSCILWLFYLRRKQTSIEQKKDRLGLGEISDEAIG